MKKIKLLLSLLVVLVLSGCGSEKLELNLETIYSNLTDEYAESVKMDAESLEGVYGIDTSLFEDYIIVMSKESSNADMYAIFELKDSEESKDEALYFISQYEKSWDNDYFPEETAKVEDGLTKETDNYVIYIVNEDTDKILEMVEGK